MEDPIEHQQLPTAQAPAILTADQDTSSNLGANNSTNLFKSTPEGMACAYLSLMIMALVPIFVGSFKSIRHQVETRAKCRETGEQAETMTVKDAAWFPVIASVALFSFYCLIRLSPELVNLAISGYFFLLGVFAIHRLLQPFALRIFPTRFNLTQYSLVFGSKQLENPEATTNSNNTSTDHTDDRQQSGTTSPTNSDDSSCVYQITDYWIDVKFTASDILAFILASALGVWYIITKHWVANNAFGLAFALNGIELLPVNTVEIGAILLGGLFFYDIFWVFGTDVMVSVAKKFDAPIKILFPQDFLINGFWGRQFAMLGLGDIVIPGIFIAFLLRFDYSLRRGSNVYFWSCFLAYIFGLGLTIGVMSYFKHAQPALLYLVPCCIIIPLLVALIKGDFKALLNYKDHPLPVEDGTRDSSAESSCSEEEKEGDDTDKKTSKKSVKTRSISTRASSKKDK